MANIIKIDNATLKRYKKGQTKKPRKISCRILIVCEGEKTEPNYFKAFKEINKESFVLEIDIKGGGINTIDVVKKAIEIKESAITPYDKVWAVFDKDDFPPHKFNGAIITAKKNDINVAWSNEAFELWYLYHFHNRDTGMHREEYKKAISDAVNSKSPKMKYVYRKNAIDNYKIMTTHGNQSQAIKWAETKHIQWRDERHSNHNPCTTVYKLVRQLIGDDKDLIDEVMAKINT